VTHRQTQTALAVHRRSVYFSGRVQGVGFRYTTRNLALGYDVQGYVRNLPDGRVELVMEGPDAEMGRVVEELRRKMNGFIRNVQTQTAPAFFKLSRLQRIVNPAKIV
jgi:acylphosphatase